MQSHGALLIEMWFIRHFYFFKHLLTLKATINLFKRFVVNNNFAVASLRDKDLSGIPIIHQFNMPPYLNFFNLTYDSL